MMMTTTQTAKTKGFLLRANVEIFHFFSICVARLGIQTTYSGIINGVSTGDVQQPVYEGNPTSNA
jgi:hypothetical protein